MTPTPTTEPDAKVTIQNDRRRPVTVERHGEAVRLEAADNTVTLEAPDEAENVATALQAVIPKDWKSDP